MKYNNRFIALDTETGGLPVKGKKEATIDIALTEIAIVVIDNESLEFISKNSWLIKPYDDNLEYNPGAEKVSGISKKMCEQEGLELQQVYESLLKVLKDNKVGRCLPIIVMQNKSFDIPFIENMFAIFGDDFNKYVDRVEDTIDFARLKFIEKPDFKLGSLAEYCGLDHTESHRALSDTEITAKVWISFIKSLRDSNKVIDKESKPEESFRKNFKF